MMTPVCWKERMAADTWVITCYSNPLGFRTRRQNFHHFADALGAQGANLLVVEMTGPEGSFELEDHDYGVVRLRGNGFIWQKERMLNVALTHLPPDCRKVVWADADVLFENSEWLDATSHALDHDVVVQPFESCVRLPVGHLRFIGETQEDSVVMPSFAACFHNDPTLAVTGLYRDHGHTGFAWAARREFLEQCGLYDACITGSGDHLMAHVFAGKLTSRCIPAMLGEDNAFARHFGNWASRAHEKCGGRLGFVPGRLLHLWHGSILKRRYAQRNQELGGIGFDPDHDIRLDTNGVWEWDSASAHLREWSEEGFRSRDEDAELAEQEAEWHAQGSASGRP